VYLGEIETWDGKSWVHKGVCSLCKASLDVVYGPICWACALRQGRQRTPRPDSEEGFYKQQRAGLPAVAKRR
jgi:hypothetical protein